MVHASVKASLHPPPLLTFSFSEPGPRPFAPPFGCSPRPKCPSPPPGQFFDGFPITIPSRNQINPLCLAGEPLFSRSGKDHANDPKFFRFFPSRQADQPLPISELFLDPPPSRPLTPVFPSLPRLFFPLRLLPTIVLRFLLRAIPPIQNTRPSPSCAAYAYSLYFRFFLTKALGPFLLPLPIESVFSMSSPVPSKAFPPIIKSASTFIAGLPQRVDPFPPLFPLLPLFAPGPQQAQVGRVLLVNSPSLSVFFSVPITLLLALAFFYGPTHILRTRFLSFKLAP